jgi:hypothetical protein
MKYLFYLPLIGLMFIGCKHERQPSENESVQSFESFKIYGDIHNHLLSCANDDFITSIREAPSSESEAIDILAEFQKACIDEMSFDEATKTSLKNGISENKDFYISDNLYQVAISQTKTRTPVGNTLNEDILLMHDSGIIDDFEYNSLQGLQRFSEANYNGTLSLEEFQIVVDEMIEQWIEQEYTENSGSVLAVSLAISQSSIEWWLENSDTTIETNAIPMWVAMDISGAIFGAAIASVRQIGTDDFDWTSVGIGALTTAITGSTGVIGKLGRWIHKL